MIDLLQNIWLKLTEQINNNNFLNETLIKPALHVQYIIRYYSPLSTVL